MATSLQQPCFSSGWVVDTFTFFYLSTMATSLQRAKVHPNSHLKKPYNGQLINDWRMVSTKLHLYCKPFWNLICTLRHWSLFLFYWYILIVLGILMLQWILFLIYKCGTPQKRCHNDMTPLWRTIGAKIQLLNFACTFGIRYCSLQFVLTSAIQHSSFQFLYSNWRFDIVCFTIQHPSLRNSTSKFAIQRPSLQFNIQVYALFNIQVYAIQHSTLENIQPQSSQWQSVWAQKTIKIFPV